MSGLSRRDLLRASAGAAVVAVPITALSSSGSASASRHAAALDAAEDAAFESSLSGPVMFCVHDAARGDVSILHGTEEVIVNDRKLVKQIIKAASARRAV